MELTFKLQDRPSPFIRELRLSYETDDGGIYIPFTDGLIRIIGDIEAIDFDGGPFMTAGYKLDENNIVESIYRQDKQIFVKVKKN